MKELLKQIRSCTVCERHLPHGVNPVLAANHDARLIIIGQAPGLVVHQTGIPWNDRSGDNLRSWLGVDKATFYNSSLTALVPMGFCYPGKGSSGDLPPRPECAPLWHAQLLAQMPRAALTLLVGSYAQKYYLGTAAAAGLTRTVQQYADYLPRFFPLPHPSPRNNIWQAKNKWFSREVLPQLQQMVQQLLP